ncbi:MAG TPA: STAS/SEC14 domain-containing protein [Rhizobiaceae bacterium]|nr:STAS/SEC14 domain-containing protein [Rhizobiaceae bacterium]
MNPLDAVPAVRRLQTSRPDLVAFEIAGSLSGPDVENLYGLLEGAYVLHSEIDLIVRASDNETVQWSKVAGDTVEEGREHARSHIRRCASVGGKGGVDSLVQEICGGSAAEYRHFGREEEADAWVWLGGREIR